MSYLLSFSIVSLVSFRIKLPFLIKFSYIFFSFINNLISHFLLSIFFFLEMECVLSVRDRGKRLYYLQISCPQLHATNTNNEMVSREPFHYPINIRSSKANISLHSLNNCNDLINICLCFIFLSSFFFSYYWLNPC